ncbi:MAG: NAD kinase [Pseudomonadota bacterium]
MGADLKIAFMAGPSPAAQNALQELSALYGSVAAEEADIIVALGGDGMMLNTLTSTQHLDTPVYGMHRGTVGFLMNEYSIAALPTRLRAAQEEIVHPLKMIATHKDGLVSDALAINEVSLLRAGPQAAKLCISVDRKVRLEELICDGALLSTPAGSTAYNYSAHGPILPIGADVLALTAISAFRPRRWRGALLPHTAKVTFEVLEYEKRPVMADADGRSFFDVLKVEVGTEREVTHRLLFDPGHGLEERLLREQFA